jgi:uncharacterized RDD family membrane protein YckC
VVDDDRTHYDILGLEPDAPKNEIKRAYQEHLEAAQGAGDAETTLRIRRAWQVLSDPVQRSRYDDSVGLTPGRRRAGPDSNGSSAPGSPTSGSEEVEILDDAEEAPDQASPGQEMEVARDWLGRPRPDRPPRPKREMPPPPPMAEGLELPALSRRVAGDAIDVITLFAFGYALYALSSVASGGASVAIFAGGFVVIVFLYLGLPVARTGQTLGKRLTYTMVVDRLSGELLTPRAVMIRYSVPTVLAVTGQFAPIAVMVGFTYAFGRDQVSLLDRMAKSIVVVARYQPTRPGSAGS